MNKKLIGIGLALIVISGLVLSGVLAIGRIVGQNTDDAGVNNIDPNQNYGSSGMVIVSKSYQAINTGGYQLSEHRMYVRFNMNLSINMTIDNAVFRIHWNYHSPPNATFRVHKVLGDWDEPTITWNNQPNYSAIPISGYQHAGLYPVRFTVTSTVQDWASGDPNHGFVVVADTGSAAQVWTKEHGQAVDYAPELEIHYSVPDPQNQTQIEHDTIVDEDGAKDVETGDTDKNLDRKVKETPVWAWYLLMVGLVIATVGVTRKR